VPKKSKIEMKKLYVHCGLHKTGTTALQIFLRNNTEKLRSAGILYPYTGCLDRVASGHHNIAWQITRDRRFEKELGDIETLRNEIGNFSGDIIISSEDFEGLLDTPSAFAPLAQYAISTHRELVLIIYVRNQISYLESLYLEMLMHGFGEEYEMTARHVIDRHIASMKEWVFHFDYRRIARRLAYIPNARLMFRNFHNLHNNSICSDFTSILGLDTIQFDGALNVQANERATPATYLSLFYQNRVGRPLSSAETEVVKDLCRDIHRQMNTGDAIRTALVRTFRIQNKRFCRGQKVPRDGLIFDTLQGETVRSTRLERFFSFETQCTIREIALQRTRLDLVADNQTNFMAVAESALKTWWTNQSAH
jgi:hypothetical protein